MPTYEYRCRSCAAVTSRVCKVADKPKTVRCERCGRRATAIISGGAVRLSNASKVARLDPKYDKMVDAAMKSTQHAEPDRLLKKMKPFSSDP